MSVNIQIILGRLGQDPETRAFPNGGSVCNFSVATTERYKDKQSGEQKEITTWHRVVLRNKMGEVAQQYLKKGSQVFIKGTTRHRKWQDKDGQDRYSTEIVGNEMTMLDSKGSSGSDQQSSGGFDQRPLQSPQPASQQAGPDYGGGDEWDDEIPFAQHMRGTVI